MTNRTLAAWVLICVGFLSEAASAQHLERQIWVLSNGFHTAVALRTRDAEPFIRSTVADPEAKWVLLGWGDRDYFMTTRHSLWITLKAVFLPTSSAIHVIPLRQLPQRVYRHSEVIEITLCEAQLRALVAYLEEQFAGFDRQKPVYLGPGRTATSSFYLGSEKFYFPKMCNWWLANALRRAGIRIHPVTAITAQELIRQMRKRGRRVGGLCLPVDGF